MEYGFDAMNNFDNYCIEKRAELSGMEYGEQREYQEKLLVARSLLHKEASAIMSYCSEYTSASDENDIDEQFSQILDALMDVVGAGLEDISFNKWKGNIEDAVSRILALEHAKRLPRFLNACEKIADSLDVDFSDVEGELRLVFEPECIYNTLVLMVTAVKLYSEILKGIYDNHNGGEMKAMHRWTSWKMHHIKRI